jgi:hypothetical protein
VKTVPHCDPEISSDPEECYWEEHGEPRKTILSSIKPRTDKPMIASILLTIVILIGIGSAIMPALFIQTPLTVLSTAGVSDTIDFTVVTQQGTPLSDITILYESSISNVTDSSGNAQLEDMPLGLRTLTVTRNTSEQYIDIFVFPFTSPSYELVIDQSPYTATVTDPQTDLTWCSIILVILSIVTMLGAFSSLRRRHSDIAIVCSAIGIFTIGFFFIGTILSIISLILIIKSKEEFDDGKKGKSF